MRPNRNFSTTKDTIENLTGGGSRLIRTKPIDFFPNKENFDFSVTQTQGIGNTEQPRLALRVTTLRSGHFLLMLVCRGWKQATLDAGCHCTAGNNLRCNFPELQSDASTGNIALRQNGSTWLRNKNIFDAS